MEAVGTKVGGRAWSKGRLPVSLHSVLLAHLPVSQRSGLLARLPSTHTLARTARADEKRDSWRHVNAHGFNSESVHLNVTGLCSKIPWLFICATSHKQPVSNRRKNYVGIFVLYHVTMLRRPPSSQLLPLLMLSAPQFKINPALPSIATIFSLPLQFSCHLPPTSLT